MKSDPKSDAKAGDKAVTGEQGPELTKVEVGPVSSITEHSDSFVSLRAPSRS